MLGVLVLDATGVRVGELEAATIGDLDEERGAWLVRASVSKTRRDGGQYVHARADRLARSRSGEASRSMRLTQPDVVVKLVGPETFRGQPPKAQTYGFSGLVPRPQVGEPGVPDPFGPAPAWPGTPCVCGVCTMLSIGPSAGFMSFNPL
jgi:hypothetical protein